MKKTIFILISASALSLALTACPHRPHRPHIPRPPHLTNQVPAPAVDVARLPTARPLQRMD